jgi:hypothetical protein
MLETQPQFQGALPAASDDLVMQLIAARHVHPRLPIDRLRDIKLLVLLLDVAGGNLAGVRHVGLKGLEYNDSGVEHLAQLAGISRDRVSFAITHLLEVGAVSVLGAPEPRLVFGDRVLRAAGAAEYVDWQSVVHCLRGHGPPLLVFRAVLDAMRRPWDWTSLTYEILAERSCYSLGMVRHGVTRLLTEGVLERSIHAGRGHEYRCSAWALGDPPAAVGRGNSTISQPAREAHTTSDAGAESPRLIAGDRPASTTQIPAGEGEMIVEVGGLTVHVPAGTVIRMQTGVDGLPYFEIGSHLRLRQRPS